MTETTSISNPIEIKDNSKERVAFDLMEKIATFERGSASTRSEEIVSQQRNRNYWFKLYNQSLETIEGNYKQD